MKGTYKTEMVIVYVQMVSMEIIKQLQNWHMGLKKN